MNEFQIIKRYLKSLTNRNLSALNLNDDISYDRKSGLSVSVDTYVHGVHFLSTEPDKFLQKIIRSSLSDLYCKGVKPKTYYLSLGIDKKNLKNLWLKKVKKILKSEQKKFNIFLSGGDTTYSPTFFASIVVLGYSKKLPVLRSTCNVNDDIYVTGNIGDSYIGLNILKKKYNFGKKNNFFINKYYKPDLACKFSSFLSNFASSSIDLSDGLAQDLNHICSKLKIGALVNLNYLPISNEHKDLINKNKILLKNSFSNGDDYQILFTSKLSNREKIKKISKKTNTKVTRIGQITNSNKIIFVYDNKKFSLNTKKMGYTHTF